MPAQERRTPHGALGDPPAAAPVRAEGTGPRLEPRATRRQAQGMGRRRVGRGRSATSRYGFMLCPSLSPSRRFESQLQEYHALTPRNVSGTFSRYPNAPPDTNFMPSAILPAAPYS